MRRNWGIAIDDFLSSLSNTYRSSETVRCCRNRLNIFHDYVISNSISIKDFTISDYTNFLDEIVPKYSSSYAQRIHRESKRFLSFMSHPSSNEVSLVRLKYNPPSIPSLTDDQYSLIFDWISTISSASLYEGRTMAYISLIMSGGLRRSEPTSITWDDLDWSNHTMNIIDSKKKVSVKAPLHPSFYDFFKIWKQKIPESSYVLPRLPSLIGQSTISTLGTSVARYSEWRSLPLTPIKRFRAALVQRLIQGGMTYDDVARLVRHETTSTTQKYYARIEYNPESNSRYRETMEGIFG